MRISGDIHAVNRGTTGATSAPSSAVHARVTVKIAATAATASAS
jgi:hypothetical protein